MLTDEEATRLNGATLVTSEGQELGSVETVLTHAADNRAAWAAVKVEERLVLVPLDGASAEDERLVVRYTAEQITSAPEHGDGPLDAEGAERLYDHYGIDDSVLRDDSGFPTEQGMNQPGTSDDPRGGGGADDATQGHP